MDTQNNPDDININIIIPILQMGGELPKVRDLTPYPTAIK